MEESLYGPSGFYSSGRGIAGGRGGDFLTSPEVGPLFGAVVARALDTWWHELGQPTPYRVFDVGTGPGTLLKTLEFAAPECSSAWELIGVDRVTKSTLPDDLSGCVVIANELLDNLVFRVVERAAHGWSEVHVETSSEPGGANEVAQEVLVECSSPGFEIAVGQRAPLLGGASDWVQSVLARGPERMLLFDYGLPDTAALANRGDWLRTYRAHQRGSDPLLEPGQWDITTDIAVDQLPTPTSVHTQAQWLGHWGIDDLVEEGRQYWLANAARPDLAAMRMRSRLREADALLSPEGLGSWLVLEYQSQR